MLKLLATWKRESDSVGFKMNRKRKKPRKEEEGKKKVAWMSIR